MNRQQQALDTLIDCIKSIVGYGYLCLDTPVEIFGSRIYCINVNERDELWMVDQSEEWAQFELTDKGAGEILSALEQKVGSILKTHKRVA